MKKSRKILYSICIAVILFVLYIIPIPVKNSYEFKKSYLELFKYGIVSKSCVPMSLNMYTVFGDNDYTVDGENFWTLFDLEAYMQAKIDLSTGQVNCSVQQKWINPGPPSVNY